MLSQFPNLTGIVAFNFCFAFFIHMFQLCGYHRDAFVKWARNNSGTICARLTFAFLVLVLSFFKSDVCTILIGILNLLTVYSFFPGKAKKPLVYTSRIKRMFFTANVMLLAVMAISNVSGMYFLSGLFIFASFFVVLACDVVNSPVEKAVKRYYINDAKKMLSQHKRLTVIGITGSYGKTSTKYCLEKMLSTKYNVLMTPASYNTPMGVVKTVREYLKPQHEIFICEMGAKYAGDIEELCNIVHPDIGIITSVGPQHLESFGSIQNVVDTKFELDKALGEKGKIYLNYDNEYIRNRKAIANFVSYSVNDSSCDCFVKDVKVSQNGTSFTLCYKDKTYDLSTKLLGLHNVQNIAGCACIAIDLGVDQNELCYSVKRLEQVEHRLQLINAGASMTIIDDAFNANPAGTKAALDVLSGFDEVKIIVTPGMIELGESQYKLNFEFGENCARTCDYIFVVGKTNREAISKGALHCGFDEKKLVLFEKVEDAVNASRQIEVQEHKYVLLENDLPDNY